MAHRARRGGIAAASVTSAFTPSDHGTVLGWWDVQQESFTDGASVSTLTDKSGNGLHLTTGGTGPTADNDGINGLRSVVFNASSPLVSNAALSESGGITVLWVGRKEVGSNNGAVFDRATSGGTPRGYIAASSITATATGSLSKSSIPGSTSEGTPFAGLFTVGSADAKVWVNTTDYGSASGEGSGFNEAFRLCEGGGVNLHVRVGEVVVWSGAFLTSISDMMSAVTAKWGI